MNQFLPLVLGALLYASRLSCAGGSEDCNNLDTGFLSRREFILTNSTFRRVDLIEGVDNRDCLQRGNTTSCRTLQYALHETEDTSVGGVVANLRIKLGPGVFVAINETAKIYNSNKISLIGSGVGQTYIVCGRNGTDDIPCSYPNFGIFNSSDVFLSGITFTGCGPITSSLYIGSSDYILIDKCSFENDISPALLVYNTPNLKISNTAFHNNTPELLPRDIAQNPCYFTRESASPFLDNRTTSGGISLFMDGETTNVLIQNCSFINNTARSDPDVTFQRRTERNGHGGGVNIRILNSSESIVCIKGSIFQGNRAEAHAGALAVFLAMSASKNNIIVSDTMFKENSCDLDECTGGAVGIDFLSGTRFNDVMFVDCNFIKNRANSSGAIVLSTSVSAISEDGLSDILRLSNTSFIANSAFLEGTALGVFSISQTNEIGIPVDIHNCHFHKNFGSRDSKDTTAVTLYRVLVTFQGDTTFFANRGGGTTLLSSRMDVRGRVHFNKNTAVFGAGVAMSGRSLILLHKDSEVYFSSNFATEAGAGIYVEYSSTAFLPPILNTGCFIRYNSTEADVPPDTWISNVTFTDNRAAVAGAAIYASDLSRCRWLGQRPGNHTIFQIPPAEDGPFRFSNNTLMAANSVQGDVMNEALATDPSSIIAESLYTDVSYDERVSFNLSSQDQMQNFRAAVLSISSPDQEPKLGSLSTQNSVFIYTVPRMDKLLNEDTTYNFSANFSATSFNVSFSILQNEDDPAFTKMTVTGCHPGYQLDGETCVCQISQTSIVRCDQDMRYFYAREGFWVGERNSQPYLAYALPGFLRCSQLDALPGCVYKYDRPDEQCAVGRKGFLCGDCQSGHGVTFDLRFCRKCDASGILLYIAICLIIPFLSLAILYFDFPIPNELKGVIFYGQVVGVIYRSIPYLLEDKPFFDFLVNMLGFAMPFPVCLHEDVPVVVMALLGYVPPLLALTTAIVYGLCANRMTRLSHRSSYGFHGFYFLFIFIYKYFVDISVIFVSCTNVDGESVFLYQGSQKCNEFPFILLVVFGSLLLVMFGVVLPIYVLKIIYAPAQRIQVRNSLSHGLKNGRRYLWYGIWDIWRRILFIGASLFISFTTRSVVLFIHCMLVLLCLVVLCLVKPYKKYHINVTEGLIILALLFTTLSVYDRDNDLYVREEVASVCIGLPFLYGGCFIIYNILKIIYRKFWPIMEAKWGVKERIEPSYIGKSIRLCTKMKEKSLEYLGIGENESDETEEAPKDLWKEAMKKEAMRTNNSASMEESYSPALREALLDDMPPTLGSPYENTSL